MMSRSFAGLGKRTIEAVNGQSSIGWHTAHLPAGE
jgi:hypothetical protein